MNVLLQRKPLPLWSVPYIDRIEKELQKWQSQSLERTLRYEHHLLDFSSNDYLCLNRDGSHAELFTKIAAEMTAEPVSYVGSTGSRLIRGHHPDFDRAEEVACHFWNAPSALYFGSGYAANIGALSAILGPGDEAYCDRLLHASLLDGVRLSGAKKIYFEHNNLNALEDRLKASGNRRGKWILSESVFSMDGDCPDVPGLLDLCERYDATLFLDEAHALGYYGSAESPGAGLLARLREDRGIALSPDYLFQRLILSTPLGKAPGLVGGFILGHSALKRYLINRARSLVFSTAPPPVLARMTEIILKQFLNHEYDDRIASLQSNADLMRQRLKDVGFRINSQSSIIPAIIGPTERTLLISKELERRGIDARAIRPPTVAEGSARIRITMHSCHAPEDIERLADVLSMQMASSRGA